MDKFIKVKMIPEMKVGTGFSEVEILLNTSSILSLLKKSGNEYEVTIKPEYKDAALTDHFKTLARLKTITTIIKNEDEFLQGNTLQNS